MSDLEVIKDSIRHIKIPFSPLAKAGALLIASIFACSVYLSVRSFFVEREFKALKEAQHNLSNDLKIKEKDLKIALLEKEKLSAQNTQFKASLAQATRVVAQRPVPAKIGPVPAQEGALKKDLEEGGLAPGLAFHMDAPSKLNLEDGRKTWTWMREAQRVPGFEARNAAMEIEGMASKTYISGLEKELGSANKAISLGQEAQGIWVKKEANYIAQVDNREVMIKVEHKKGNLKLVYGFGIGVGAKILYDVVKHK